MVALLLTSVAGGSSYLEVHAPPNIDQRATWRDVLSKEGKDFDQQLELERVWVQTTRDAVSPHLELLYGFINNEEPELRYAIAEALGCYPDQAAHSIQMLEAAIELETEDYVLQAMEEAISRLKSNGE